MEDQLRGAAAGRDLATVRRILQPPPGVNVNAAGVNGWTALHLAVISGHSDLAIVQAILQVDGVNVDARDYSGRTPLHLASGISDANQLPIIQALLEAGADPNVADNIGSTPLFYYVIPPCPISVVEALLAGGANPAARNNNHNTPLHIACQYGRLKAVQVLLQHQGSECLITLKNNREETPLDRLVQAPSSISGGVTNSVRQHILQAYARMIAQRDGPLCLHSVLQDTTFIDGNNGEFRLPIGKLNTEYLQSLLEYTIAAEPGSVRALDDNGLLPLQAACQLNFPDLVVHVLLHAYPGALLLL